MFALLFGRLFRSPVKDGRWPVAAAARAQRAALHAPPDVREEGDIKPYERGRRMIKLHHGRDDRAVMVNADLIETVEATPDTVVTLTTNRKLIVRETPEEVVALVIEFRRRASPPHVIG